MNAATAGGYPQNTGQLETIRDPKHILMSELEPESIPGHFKSLKNHFVVGGSEGLKQLPKQNAEEIAHQFDHIIHSVSEACSFQDLLPSSTCTEARD